MHRPFCVLLIGCLTCVAGWGQAVSSGGYFSPKGTGISTILDREGYFYDISAAFDLEGMILGATARPGVRASLLRASVLATPTVGETVLRFYAGPGVAVGYVRDNAAGKGVMGCLCGGFGMLAELRGDVLAGVSIMADFGLHMTRGASGQWVLDLYRNGLYRAWWPEVRVLHRFGQPSAPVPPGQGSHWTWGVEWGVAGRVLTRYDYYYRDDEGVRVHEDDTRIGLHPNGEVLACIGYDVLPMLNVALYGGYAGVDTGLRMFPLSIRVTYMAGRGERDGMLVMADGGLTFREERHESWVVKAGTGYRFRLARAVNLDFLIVLRGAMTHPTLIDPESRQAVPARDVFRNDRFAGSVGLSMAVSL